VIYETFTTARADGAIEYGFCFKAAPGADDAVAPDIVVGVMFDNLEGLAKRAHEDWTQWEWVAQAVANAGTERGL
jgi:hypothetical protein